MDTKSTSAQPAAVPHEVLSTISHELRGPLGVARGYLRLLAQTTALDARAARMASDAQRATDRLAELLDEVSDFARWVRGQHTLMMTRVSLAEVAAAAVAAAALPAEPEVHVEVDAAADMTLQGDGPQLTRALAALISAVVRANTHEGAIRVVVRSAHEGRAIIRVALLAQLEAATEERDPVLERAGAGLSIALAELLVRRHGGRLVEIWAGDVWAGYACQL